MSNQALTWAFGLSLGSAAQKAVLLYLADAAHDDGTCAWPSVIKIRVATELSERAVRSALKALQERGLIELGDQRHAALGRNGTTVPLNRRSKVWDLRLNMPVERFDHVERAADVEERLREEERRKRRAERTQKKARQADAADARPETADENVGCTTCTPENGAENALGCTTCTSWGAGGAPKPKYKTLNPSVSYGDISPRGGESDPGTDGNGTEATADEATAIAGGDASRLVTEARELAATLVERQAQAGMIVSKPSKRDEKALLALLDAHGGETVVSVLDWALRDPFWRPKLTSGRAFARHFAQIHNQRLADDLPAQTAGRATEARAADTARRGRERLAARLVASALRRDGADGLEPGDVFSRLLADLEAGAEGTDALADAAVEWARRKRAKALSDDRDLAEFRKAHGGSAFAGNWGRAS